MPSAIDIIRRSCAATALMLAVTHGAPAEAQRAEGVFAGLPGNWSGTGTINLSNGNKERIRCRASYQMRDADNLQQSLRCASDSFTFDLSSEVRSEGGNLTGTWSEATRGAGGMITGKASPGQVQARVDGPGFSADLSLSTRGDRQTVQIRSEGTELTGVTITLARSK